MHFIGVFNRDGGTLRTLDLAAFCEQANAIFEAAGHSFECRLCAGADLVQTLRRATRDPKCDAILAAGGDGTISAAATACYESQVPLAVLPAGTMNLFAHSLKMPLDLGEALEAVAAGSVGAVDIATANGVPFIHQFSVGLHARLIRRREGITYNGRIGKVFASFRAVVRALRQPLRFDAEIGTSRGREMRKATAISVSNNLLSEGHAPYAEKIDQGILGVYVVKPLPPLELARLTLTLMFGSWKHHRGVSEREVTQVTLRFPHRKSSAQAVIDGELVPLEARVDLRIHPRALKVVLPGLTARQRAQAAEASADTGTPSVLLMAF